MSRRRAPFRRRYSNTKYGRYAIDERTGTPRYVTFRPRHGEKKAVVHVVQSVSEKVSQPRPRRQFYSVLNGRAQWRWRRRGIQTVCRRLNAFGYEEGQLHDRVDSTDRKCLVCFGSVPGAVIPHYIPRLTR